MTAPPRPALQGGFTLIELMVVVVIVGILASIGVNAFTGYVREGNVSRATPYLMSIAAKQRIHFNRTGRYLATIGETDIQSRLGVDLTSAGDFCFMTFCTDGTTCGAYTGTPATLVSTTVGTAVATPTGSPTTAFQVIAVLREKAASGTTGGTVTGAGQTCTVVPQTGTATPKQPSGWVGSSGTRGGEGRVVVLSYPPVNGTFTATIGSHTSTLDWRDGVTLTDALAE